MPSTTPEGRKSPGRGFFQSPNVRTRIQEKEELSDLNDRFATYIDRMRFLEHQNTKLTAEITTSKESVTREVANVKSLYETELSEARKLLDDTAKEKALLQLENNKISGLLEDLRQKLDKESTLRQRAEDELKRIERRLHEKESLLVVVTKERKELDNKVKELEQQVKDLQEELDHQKAKIEKEIIQRVDAENRAQTLQEELDFYKQVHEKELAELRVHSETYKYTLDKTDSVRSEDMAIRDKLQELRDEFEDEAENAKKELEDAYQQKYDQLRNDSDRERTNVTRLVERHTEVKTELDNLKSDYALLESKYKQLQKRLSEVENLRNLDKDDFKRQLQDREDQITKLKDDIEDLEKENENLIGIKIALDMEISAYRKLLEGEEERLHIASPPPIQRPGSRRGTKRGRTEAEPPTVENTATGSIEISECDPEGRFIKIYNKSDNDEALGGWYVQRYADSKDEEAIEYKFTPKYVLKAQQTTTIWSSSTGVKHKPPTDLLAKNDWPVGSSSTTSVINPESEIVAKHSMVLPPVTEQGTKKARRRRAGAERESCAVM